jgi:hypothetical protein
VRLERAALAAAWLLAGCATTGPSDPLSTVQHYLELAADERPNAAYAMLSEPFRHRCDLACFTRLAASQRDDARRALTDLRAGGEAHTESSAELRLPDGTALHLSYVGPSDSEPRPKLPDPGTYLFSDNPLEFYPQSTPAETVRSFVRAVNARRYQALLRFVPKVLAEQLSAEQLRQRFEGPARPGLQAQLTALQKHWDEPFQLDGTTARLPTGEGQEVRLILEQGRWRVAQLQ